MSPNASFRFVDVAAYSDDSERRVEISEERRVIVLFCRIRGRGGEGGDGEGGEISHGE